jgi:hypothetical protein
MRKKCKERGGCGGPQEEQTEEMGKRIRGQRRMGRSQGKADEGMRKRYKG